MKKKAVKIIFASVDHTLLGCSDISDNLAVYCQCETDGRVVCCTICLSERALHWKILSMYFRMERLECICGTV